MNVPKKVVQIAEKILYLGKDGNFTYIMKNGDKWIISMINGKIEYRLIKFEEIIGISV